MKHKIFLALTFLLISLYVYAQDTDPWTQIQESDIRITGERLTTPKKYLSYQLDAKTLASILQRTPQEVFDSKVSKSTLALPVPDGTMQEFYIFESSVMHPDLARKYPDIKSYLGYGVNNTAYYLRFDVTPLGFHAMVLGPEHNVYLIDPMAKGDTEHYISYYKSEAVPTGDFTCSVEESGDFTGGEENVPSECGILRRYDMALAATGEFTAYFGTVAATLAAMNTLLTRVNGIYERDVRVRFQLIANNDLIIFTNPETDPYSGDQTFHFIYQNQESTDEIIGFENYDIGHVIHKSDENHGGARVGGTCNFEKAVATTRHINPLGDPFAVDYFCHEVGHQFSARHSQNTTSTCNEHFPSSMEPGSGSTIMGYSGVCAPNVQDATDDYFHRISLNSIDAFTIASTCADVLSTTNAAPSIDAGPDRTFPKNTPFVLTAIGSDPNDASITYCWEQMNNEQSTTTPPQNTETGGPLFRSFQPTTNASRWFPRLSDVVANISPTWEVLPDVARNLKFIATVRDNYAGGGCTAQDGMLITVDGNSGPFLVTSPNVAGLSYCGGSSTTVTWDPANTNTPPVSCYLVDVLLSTDGGVTFPFLLKSSILNGGSTVVSFPMINSTQCRIMVRAQFGLGNQNTFYDISNENFEICTAIAPSTPPPALQYICYGRSNCYVFPSSDCHTGFIVESLDPKVMVHVFGMQVCLTNLKPMQRTARVNVTPTGPCGYGPTQQWTIFIDYHGACSGQLSPSFDRDQIADEGENVQVFVNQKAYLFEDVNLDGSAADHRVDVEVYDLQGKLLLSNSYDTRQITLKKSDFPAGVLILKIKFQGKHLTDKILNFRN